MKKRGHGDVAARPPVPRRLRTLARWMDEAIALPGGFRIGWDGIIGLIPGIGDLSGLAVSAYIIAESARLGAGKSVLARMSLNAVLEALLGAVPLAGDLFDFVFKANKRNLRLLEAHLAEPGPARRASIAWLAALGCVALLAVLTVLLLLVRIVTWAWQWVWP